MRQNSLLKRITVNPGIFGGKPIIRGRRLAVETVLGMLAAGDTTDTLLEGYPWLELDDILACLAYAHRLVQHERGEPLDRRCGGMKILLDTCVWGGAAATLTAAGHEVRCPCSQGSLGNQCSAVSISG
jgi:uncharacterized protein (DUF433 family)